MRVAVDAGRCIGNAACESICPEVFRVDEDGLAVVALDPVPEPLKPAVQRAIDACPTTAIAWE